MKVQNFNERMRAAVDAADSTKADYTLLIELQKECRAAGVGDVLDEAIRRYRDVDRRNSESIQNWLDDWKKSREGYGCLRDCNG